MKKSLTTKKSEIKKSPHESGSQAPSSSGDFSIADFGLPSFTDAKDKLGIYMEALVRGPESIPKSIIFDRVFELNNSFGTYKLDSSALIELYTQVVIYDRSYTKIENLDSPSVREMKGVELPTLSFQDLMSQSFPKARYAVEPFFEAGTVNMVSAPPNTWKSWLLFLCSTCIAQGTSLLDQFPTEQSKVMIVNEEDSFRAIQDRFRILNITDTTLPIFFRVANGSKFESKFIDKLILELKEKQIGVVIFDSLRSMHEADENDSTAMQIILDQMKKISREGITVIFTHHHRKKGMFEKQSSAESSRGSSAINAAISGHISLDEEERETGLYLIIRHLKSKAGEKLPAFEVKIIKSEGKVEFKYDGEFKQAEKKIMQAKDGIMDILKDGKWKSKKDFEALNIGKNNMIQALQVLKNDGMILSITRKQAILKSIPVSLKGHSGELYYCLNTESSELITRKDEEAVNQEFNDF